MLFSEKVYNFLKQLALVILPALAAAYFSIAQIWGLPNAEEVVGTITVIDTLMGVLLKLSSSQYNKSEEKYDGALRLVDTEDGTQLHFDQLDSHAVMTKGAVLLKIKDENP